MAKKTVQNSLRERSGVDGEEIDWTTSDWCYKKLFLLFAARRVLENGECGGKKKESSQNWMQVGKQN